MIDVIGWTLIIIAATVVVIGVVYMVEINRDIDCVSKSIHKFVTEGRVQLEEEKKRWEKDGR